MSEPIQNLFTLLRLVAEPAVVDQFTEAWNDCSIRYGDLKREIAQGIIKVIAPMRERYEQLYADTGLLNRIRREGAEKVRGIVRANLAEMRSLMGIRMF